MLDTILNFTFKEEYEELKAKLKKVWDKDKSSDQILYLLRETYASRRVEMKGLIGRLMFKICSNYPMLMESKYVIELIIYVYSLCIDKFQWLM